MKGKNKSKKYARVSGVVHNDSDSDEEIMFEVNLEQRSTSDNGASSAPQQPRAGQSTFDIEGGTTAAQSRGGASTSSAWLPYCNALCSVWSTLLFTWMIPLLELGNKRPLEQSDLFELAEQDKGAVVYAAFRKQWKAAVQKSKQYNARTDEEKARIQPSLAKTYLYVFGYPFMVAGALKLVHDSCLFIGPNVLNKIIVFLGDPSQPQSVGLQYVAILFVANLTMSLCLRQYFWWCYRVGMRLRSATVTSVYSKSLVLNAGVFSRRTNGEIANLMSIDAQRLQDLTPYLHAVWYSFFQIAVALYFLYEQVGLACLGGVTVIILAIPMTGKISAYLKKLQKELSKVRDDRVKLSCEVLAGMKVIKFQSWEGEFCARVEEVREREMAVFWQYSLAQALSGAVYTGVPILVGICTFVIYVAMGNTLHVSTALTSLALFEILRFPLYMLPNVLNNLVEAKVSVDRVESYLIEPEKVNNPEKPLKQIGAKMIKATLAYDGCGRTIEGGLLYSPPPKTTCYMQIKKLLLRIPVLSRMFPATASAVVTKMASESKVYLNDAEYETLLLKAQLDEANRVIDEITVDRELIKSRWIGGGGGGGGSSSNLALGEYCDNAVLNPLNPASMDLTDIDSATGINGVVSVTEIARKKNAGNILALSRVDLFAKRGDLIAVVGQVGCGKSSLLQALLGELRLCSGQVALKGRIAYVGQRPFIMNATLRDNITFGEPFEIDKYQRTLQMCALGPDLHVLPSGDMTEIGERGINLSGGQRARVALARAVYSDAELYLLDDPLSAVDAHVGQHLFDECIMALKNEGKCIVLVTNALHFLKSASYIVVLKSSRVAEAGSYEQLIAMRSDEGKAGLFADMVSTFQDTQEVSSPLTARVQDELPIEIDGEEQKIGDLALVVEENDKTDDAAQNKQKVEIKLASDQTKSDKGKLMTVEDRELGDVDREVYKKWAYAGGGLLVAALIVASYIGAEMISVTASWWLSYWSANREMGTPWFFLGIYIVINVGVVVATLGKEIIVRVCGWRAADSLFKEMLHAVLYAPMSFFDTTPMGRITNRFSKDVYTVDEQLPMTMRGYLGTVLKVVSVILYIVFVTPLFILGLGPIFGFYYFAQRYFIKTSRELARLDSGSRSPIYALFSETLEGLACIRAYRGEDRLTKKCYSLLDSNQKAYFLKFSANCWLAVRLEFAGTLIVTCAALFAVLARDDSSTQTVEDREAFAGMAGLAVSLALSVTQSLNWSVRMASDLESHMVSVERIKTYSNMPQEKAHHTINDPPEQWPQTGAIEIKQVYMRYREGMPRVLSGVDLVIPPRHKVGIVGRTGAGKSSLLSALLRIVELESGSISIDGVNVANIGLHTLRSRIAVIPQDPVLFSGSIRSNLDPFGNFTDTQIWESLRRTCLHESVEALTDKVEDGGTNYSVGQRQLLCISRALLAQAKIIVLDEATAAVDVETDSAIQKTLRQEFADATVLTVAHRLNTIMDSDKIVVMDQGRVAEYDSPSVLLSQPTSMFKQLADNWEKANA